MILSNRYASVRMCLTDQHNLIDYQNYLSEQGKKGVEVKEPIKVDKDGVFVV